MTKAQVTAAALAEQWRASEIEMRARHRDRPEETVTSPRSAAIERCRMELEAAFNINPTIR